MASTHGADTHCRPRHLCDCGLAGSSASFDTSSVRPTPPSSRHARSCRTISGPPRATAAASAGGCVCPPSVAPPPLRSSSSGRGKTRRRRRRANALAWRTWCAARDPWLASHTHAVRCRSCAERAAPSRSRSPRMRSWRTCCPTRTTFRLVRAHRVLFPSAARHAAARAAAGCRAVRRVIVIPRAPLRAGRTVARGHTRALPMRCARSMSH